MAEAPYVAAKSVRILPREKKPSGAAQRKRRQEKKTHEMESGQLVREIDEGKEETTSSEEELEEDLKQSEMAGGYDIISKPLELKGENEKRTIAKKNVAKLTAIEEVP